MKRLIIVAVLLFLSFLNACRKDEVEQTPLASLMVTNGVIEAPNLKLGSNMYSLSPQTSWRYGLVSGSNQLYVWPEGDSLNPIYNHLLHAEDGDIYSLFVAGEIGGDIRSVIVKENFPTHEDKSGNIRFIHLSPNTSHINIKLAQNISHEFSDIEYTEKTLFKSYPAGSGETYSFEILDSDTGNVLNTIAISPAMNKNITLAVTGVAKGSPAINIIQINH